MTWQLVVHDDEDLALLMTDLLRKALKAQQVEVQPVEARNLQRARRYLEDMKPELCSVVLIGSATPLDPRTPVGLAGRDPTRQFIKELKAKRPDLPVIVLANTPDASLAGFVEAFENAAVVAVDSTLSARIEQCLAEFHGAASVRSEARMIFNLHLRDRKSATWQIHCTGDKPLDETGELYIDESLLERVLFDSEQIQDKLRLEQGIGCMADERWLRMLKYLSDDLRRLLFDGTLRNSGCWETFSNCRARVGGIDHALIRVTVNNSTHPLLIEALRDHQGNDSEYWALRAPLFRRYDHPAARQPLFKDTRHPDAAINCLIIEADGGPGTLTDYGVALDALDYCAQESRDIVAVLRRAGLRAAGEALPGADAACPVKGRYEHLRLAEQEGDLRTLVQRKLAEQTWHVVHFCGHVVGATSSDAGLVLAAERGGVLEVATLAAQLEGTQLMFLSSCRSASTRIVVHAVEQYIPAVLGFQWVIDDAGAAEFALAFYDALFDPGCPGFKYLEYAFMLARRAVYKSAPRAPTWVAPVLVMQMD